jgi:hypothetical protein
VVKKYFSLTLGSHDEACVKAVNIDLDCSSAYFAPSARECCTGKEARSGQSHCTVTTRNSFVDALTNPAG